MSPLPLMGFVQAAAGIPPRMSGTDWSLADSFVLLLVYIGAFVFAVWFVAWIDIKLSSRRLFRDIRRELGIGKRPPR